MKLIGIVFVASALTFGSAHADTGPILPTTLKTDIKPTEGAIRRATCSAQYKANKLMTPDGNAGLKWNQAGGGYYSKCNKALKAL